MNDNDSRDILIEIRNDVKHLTKSFDEHIKADAVQFAKQEGSIQWLQRIVWGVAGVIVFLQMVDKVGPALAYLTQP